MLRLLRLEIRATAEAEATKEREAALAEVQVERDRMLGDLRSQIAALAIAAAQKLVGESLDEKRQHALIDEFFSGVRAGKVEVLEGASLSGASAEVTSALPLSSEEMDAVKNDILSKVGSQATVSFRVDPEHPGWSGHSCRWQSIRCLCGRSVGIAASIHLLNKAVDHYSDWIE